jgi:hypothetical protein
MTFQTLLYIRKWLDFGHMNTSYCKHCQKISIIWWINPNKICSSKLCSIYIWDFDWRIQLLMWKCTCECWEFSLSFSHISNSPWKCIWVKPCLRINLDSQPLVFTQPWLQAQGWCYDNIPHLKWGQCPNWHYVWSLDV